MSFGINQLYILIFAAVTFVSVYAILWRIEVHWTRSDAPDAIREAHVYELSKTRRHLTLIGLILVGLLLFITQ